MNPQGFMDAGASHMAVLIRDILNYGQLQNGNFKLDLEEMSLVEDVVTPAWRMLRLSPQGREKGAGKLQAANDRTRAGIRC